MKVASLRSDTLGQGLLMALPHLLIVIFAIALFIVGGLRANDGCFASALYWIAGGAFLLIGVEGTLTFKTPWGFVIGGATAGVLALAGFVGSLVGMC